MVYEHVTWGPAVPARWEHSSRHITRHPVAWKLFWHPHRICPNKVSRYVQFYVLCVGRDVPIGRRMSVIILHAHVIHIFVLLKTSSKYPRVLLQNPLGFFSYLRSNCGALWPRLTSEVTQNFGFLTKGADESFFLRREEGKRHGPI